MTVHGLVAVLDIVVALDLEARETPRGLATFPAPVGMREHTQTII